MVEQITNANDVELIISPLDESGETIITNMARIAVDDYNISEEEDSEGLSGVGNGSPIGITIGDKSIEFSFTAQGSNAELIEQVIAGGDFRFVEFIAKKGDYSTKVRGRITSYEEDASSGDPFEVSIGGIGATFDIN